MRDIKNAFYDYVKTNEDYKIGDTLTDFVEPSTESSYEHISDFCLILTSEILKQRTKNIKKVDASGAVDDFPDDLVDLVVSDALEKSDCESEVLKK